MKKKKSEIRNHNYVRSVIKGMPAPIICEFANAYQGRRKKPMDIDALILLINGGFLICEIKHIRKTEVSDGEAITVESISLYASQSGKESFWVILVQYGNEYTGDDLYVEKYGVGDTVLWDNSKGQKTLNELIDEINGDLMQQGKACISPKAYAKYLPVRVNFAYQFKDGGFLFGLISRNGVFDEKEVLLINKLAGYLTKAGRWSFASFCKYDELTEEGSVFMEDLHPFGLYVGGRGWWEEIYAPIEIIKRRRRKTVGKNKGYFFDTSILK